MIWGKTLDPGKLYSETVTVDIHLSMAALESRCSRGAEYNGYTQVMLKTDDDEFLLCTLVHGLIFQQNLDVQLKQGDKISMYTEGKNKVYLTGYSIFQESDVIDPGNANRTPPVALAIETEGIERVDHTVQDSYNPIIKRECVTVDVAAEWQRIVRPSGMDYHEVLISPPRRAEMRRNRAEMRRNRLETRRDVPVMVSSHSAVRFNHTTQLQESLNNSDDDVKANVTKVVSSIINGAVNDEPIVPSDRERTHFTRELSSPSLQRQQFIIDERVSQGSSEDMTDYIDIHVDVNDENKPDNVPQQLTETHGTPPTQYLSENNNSDMNDMLIPSTLRGYQCQFCFKVFKHVSNFKSHQLIHTNLKPYKCRFCGVGFKQTGNLKAHERIHTGDKPYKCSYCNKQFARSTTRNTHEKLHTGSAIYQCSICQKVFMQINSLKKHELSHGVQGP